MNSFAGEEEGKVVGIHVSSSFLFRNVQWAIIHPKMTFLACRMEENNTHSLSGLVMHACIRDDDDIFAAHDNKQ